MKQGNAAIRRKQVKQIPVFRAWWPPCEFCRYMFLGVWPFFVHKSFYSGAKGLHKSVQLELGKSQKGIPINKHLVILPLFKRCASRYSGLDSFRRRLFAVEQKVFELSAISL